MGINRSCFRSATSIALMTTVINGIVLFVLEGQEMIWVCFGACAADVSKAFSSKLKLILSQQMTANVVVLYWAMQGPGSSSDAQGQSIHFSPIPQTHDVPPCTFNIEHSLETGTVQSNSVYFTTLPNYAQPQEDSLSQGKTIPSSICVSTFEKPKPALQSPYYAARLGQHPQECRLSMPVTTEQFVEPSDVSSLLILATKSMLTFDSVTAHQQFDARADTCAGNWERLRDL
jgi:hypothetical protein